MVVVAAAAAAAAAVVVVQERPAVADKPARRWRNVCTVYVRAVEL